MNAVAAILDPGQSAATRAPFAAFVCDDASASVLSPIMAERGWAADMVFAGGIAAGVRMMGGMPCPEFLLVDLSDCVDPRADMQALADVCEAGTVVLAIGTMNDVTLYRDLMQAGVFDYLVKPLSTDLLRDAIAAAEDALHASEPEAEAEPVGAGERTVCIGVRGGLGTSTLVTNIAWLLAEKDQSTVLLDLDLYFGTSAMQFDLEPGRGLSDALDNPDRVDGLFLERAVVKPHAKLSILGSEAPVGSVREPAEGALSHLVTSLADNFRNVVVDLPRQLLGAHSDILGAAKDIVLVTDCSLTAARDCIRLMAHIRQTAPAASVHIVAFKGMAVAQEVAVKDFENSIEHAIDIVIPFDTKTLMAAAQRSKLVVDDAPTSKLSAAYKETLALIVHDDEGAQAKSSGWFAKLMKK